MEVSAEVDFRTGRVSATGSEEFVIKVLDWARAQREVFSTSIESEKRDVDVPSSGQGKVDQKDSLAGFPDVFSTRGDDVVVIADLSQNNTADTARQTTLLYLFGRKLIGKEETSDDEIRALCEEHGCYDPKNFAAHIKGLKGKIIQEGSSRSYTARLTTPGARQAKAIAEKIQSNEANA